jgi:hypothetical protein
VPKIGETVVTEGPVDEPKTVDQVRQEPYTLPAPYMWVSVDVTDPKELDEVYDLLYNHYVEDDDNMFRFDYSRKYASLLMKGGFWLWGKIACCSMYVCIYVCMCVCMYVYMYVCMCVCMFVCMYACVYVCIYVCMYMCMYIGDPMLMDRVQSGTSSCFNRHHHRTDLAVHLSHPLASIR